jgi:prepilin-type N-terminal cleavage/methylation domain-containing protein
MLQNLKKRNQGFTIVEVMIVLAIAGLIIMIVFLAVPALQRQSRNTAIRNDTAAVLAGVNEFTQNNNGQLPTTIAVNATTGVVTITGGAGTAAAEAKVRPGTAVQPNFTGAMPTVAGTIQIRTGLKCNGNAFGAATPRAIAAGYTIETSGTPAPQCTES